MRYRNQTRNGDAWKLDDIQLHMIQQGFIVEREVRKEINGIKREIADIQVKFPNGNINLQLDGYRIHGTLESQQNQKTRKRNSDLEKMGIEWRIIDEALCKALNIKKEDMATYLSYEANMHLIARSEKE